VVGERSGVCLDHPFIFFTRERNKSADRGVDLLTQTEWTAQIIITSIEAVLADTDQTVVDVLVTGISLPINQFLETSLEDPQAFALQVWSILLDGETEIIAPIGDFFTTTYSNFITLESGVHFGENSVYRGAFNAAAVQNGEGNALSGDVVYFGGEMDFLGAATELNGVRSFLLMLKYWRTTARAVRGLPSSSKATHLQSLIKQPWLAEMTLSISALL